MEILSTLFSELVKVSNAPDIPLDFLTLSVAGMKNLQVAGRSNVIYLLAKAVGTRRADDADTLLPVRRMPMGLIEYTTSLPLVYSTVHSGVECGTIFSASEVLQPLLNVQNRQPADALSSRCVHS